MKKNIKIAQILLIPFLLIGIVSCEKDNYEAPSSSLVGRLVDKQTGNTVPQQTINGGILRLFQTDLSDNAIAITSYFRSDGTFENKMLFDGNYKVVADGPFFYDDTVSVKINKVTNQDIQVRPFLYVTAELESTTATSAKVKVTTAFGPDNTKQKIARVGIVAGTTNSVDINFFSKRELTNTEQITDKEILETVYSYELKDLKPKTTYYIRGAARTINTGSYYNYAPILTITTD
ncbi:DUF3823 domain-containing protein [Sphingobacterium sp. UDSM-2020]|uniref:DUF3823 domain-containing protein n=1 Tax=Sphingobacterium sp. UDSM-2020 TaxID=2795738 RepID=UPI001935E692|nr:DUF3823 domain-containing protein [Sphingobacterium sp. UDSM-2020]QQD11646.1 DUF3823 domain-containing protein [Sphingobacterium sp. UDSM-2020]